MGLTFVNNRHLSFPLCCSVCFAPPSQFQSLARDSQCPFNLFGLPRDIVRCGFSSSFNCTDNLCSSDCGDVMRQHNFWDSCICNICTQRVKASPLLPLSSSPIAEFSATCSSDNRDKVETYLAFGASRLEACKPIATEALRLALTPTINQMR